MSILCRHSNQDTSDSSKIWEIKAHQLLIPSTTRQVSHILFGVIYFPPNWDGGQTIAHILSCLDIITRKHPYAGIILCGDFNSLNDRSVVNYPLKQIVPDRSESTYVWRKADYEGIANYLYNIDWYRLVNCNPSAECAWKAIVAVVWNAVDLCVPRDRNIDVVRTYTVNA